jgi:hypothetical protein
MMIGITNSTAQAADLISHPTDTQNISKYLVDISATQVSAGGLVGLTNSAITEIQSAQDLVLAVNPFSSGSSKNGYGIAITPARTDILPMSGKAYKDHWWNRIFGAGTISYAENTSSISGVSYREWAASVDTTYYPNPEDDPIIKASRKYSRECPGLDDAHKAATDFENELAFKHKGDMTQMTQDEKDKLEKLHKAPEDAWKKCLADKPKWNATKISLSAGYGGIRPDTAAGPSESLGTTFTAGGIFKVGGDGAAYFTLKNTWHEVDLTTLSGTPTFKDSFLGAIRFTYGSENGGNMRWLAEWSNARDSSVTVSNAVFMYALGIDMKVFAGTWLQFRVGRNRTADNTTNQATSLLSLNWAPSSTLFGSKWE